MIERRFSLSSPFRVMMVSWLVPFFLFVEVLKYLQVSLNATQKTRHLSLCECIRTASVVTSDRQAKMHRRGKIAFMVS